MPIFDPLCGGMADAVIYIAGAAGCNDFLFRNIVKIDNARLGSVPGVMNNISQSGNRFRMRRSAVQRLNT